MNATILLEEEIDDLREGLREAGFCTACDGGGRVLGTIQSFACPTCDGEGSPDGVKACGDCEGLGLQYTRGETCQACGGSGKIVDELRLLRADVARLAELVAGILCVDKDAMMQRP